MFVAYVDDAQLTLGFDRSQLGWTDDGKPDPDTWYLGEQVGEPGLPDILPANADTASLLDALGVNAVDGGRAVLTAEQVRTLGIHGQHLFAALARASLEVDGPLSLEIDSDDAGRVSQIHIEDDAGTEPDVMTIAIDYDINRFDVPAYESAQPVPGWPGTGVAPIWALLGGGTNYAHIDLDDGETWDAGVMLNWPGYRLISDPCGPDYERYLEVTGASGD